MGFLIGRLLGLAVQSAVKLTGKQLAYKVVLASGKTVIVTLKVVGGAIVGAVISTIWNQ